VGVGPLILIIFYRFPWGGVGGAGWGGAVGGGGGGGVKPPTFGTPLVTD